MYSKNKKMNTLLLGLIITLFVTTLSFQTMVVKAETISKWSEDVDISWYDANEDIFEIDSAQELAGLASLVNSGTTFSGKTVTLTDNIDLDGYEWVSIGSGSIYSFQGIFDGQNHTISNLYINSNSSYQGLFGCVKNGTVKNVNVEGDISGAGYVAGVVGYLVATSSDIMVDNCTFSGSISNATYNVGGIVGAAASVTEKDYGDFIMTDVNTDYTITISNCSNYATINSSASCVGGIVGLVAEAKSSTVINCYNEGNITSSSVYVGGVIGQIHKNSTVENCSNIGDVTATGYLGGVIGEVNASTTSISVVTNCTNMGTVTNTSGAGKMYTGGIIGRYFRNSSYAIEDTTLTVTHCLNTGDIIATGGNMVAGIIGSIENGTISTSYCFSEGDIIASSDLGGIIGNATGNNVSVEVSDCYYNSHEITTNTTLTTYGTGLNADEYVAQYASYLAYLESLKEVTSISVSINDWTYGDTTSTPSYTTNSDGSDVTYYYYIDSDASEEIADITLAQAGTYYLVASIASTDVYQSAVSEMISFTIKEKVEDTMEDPSLSDDEDITQDSVDTDDEDISEDTTLNEDTNTEVDENDEVDTSDNNPAKNLFTLLFVSMLGIVVIKKKELNKI